jgi:hypothetical protein
MKKIILAFLISALSGTFVYGQVEFSLGAKLGVNRSKFSLKGSEDITGFQGGAFALIKITKFAIQPEFLYMQQGSQLKDVNADLKTSYVAIPVMLKFYLLGGLNVQAGPQFGFLTAAELGGQSVKNSIKDSDVTANFGLGWDLPFGLTVDARYNFGIKDIGDMNGDEIKSRVFQFSVGYKFLQLGN